MASSNYDAAGNNKDLESYVMSVGISFVNAYYKQLGEDPAGLAYFFAADSAFTWVENDPSDPVGSTAFGRDAIVARLKQLKLDHAQVHITSVHCQPSVNHAVLVQVVGEITPSQQLPSEVYQFAQVFFLVKVAHKFRYYCYNDCFRYISSTPVPEAAPATTQHEEPEYPVKSTPAAAAPASPQRHEGNILGGSDPIAPASHSASHPSAGVIGPASTSTSAVAAPTTAAKEEAPASPINLASQFGAGGYGIGGTYHQNEQQTNDWAEEEEPEIVAKPEPEPTPTPEPTPAPARTQPAKETAPAASKGWNTIEKVAPVPIASQAKAAAQTQAAPAPVQEESEEEDTGKPSSWLDILKRKQRKGAAPSSGPVTVQAPASAPRAAAQDTAGARAKLAQERKDFEAREAEKRRPREPLPERRPRQETPRFGVFVGKMPSDAVEKDVSEVFQTFGPVANVRIPQGKRVAFVDFQTEAGRTAAIAAGKASVLGQQVVITEPQQNPAGERKPQGQGAQGAQGGKTQAPRPKAGAKTGGKQ